MLLPRPELAQVDESKIKEYLLSTTHPGGRSKARYLLSRGFDPLRWQELAEALRRHGTCNPVAASVESNYGTRYVVDGSLSTPVGVVTHFRTVWILGIGQARPRLVTAYPMEQKS
jgi:hypothetical protein